MAKEKAKPSPVSSFRSNVPCIPEYERQQIAERAYFRALDRGFQGGDPVEDWLTAEREIIEVVAKVDTVGRVLTGAPVEKVDTVG